MRPGEGLNTPAEGGPPYAWWQRRDVAALLALLMMVPLVWPDVPPLVDLPGHMGRYRVQLEIGSSPALAHFYHFEWALIGNLGLDLLVMPLAPLLGLELAVKLIVMTIPAMTAAGFLWIAREVHGRIPPTALFALPLTYNFPFIFGFANFALSMALAMLAFGFWLRLARLGHVRLRAALFLPISVLIWLTHAFGWGTLGLMAFSAELVRQHDRGHGYVASAFRSGIHCIALAPPMLLMLAWRSGHVGGETGDWFNMEAKLAWLTMALRDRWMALDALSLAVLGLLLVRAVRSKRIGFSRNLAASALVLAAMFLLLPRIVFGSAYADMRLIPYAIAIAVVAIRMYDDSPRFQRTIALAGLAFLLARTGGTTLSFWLYDRTYDRHLAALEHVPREARLVSFVGTKCRPDWMMSRLEHLPAMALVRNRAFSNDQWSMAGAQLLSVRFAEGRGFRSDPSQLIVPERCGHEIWRAADEALARFPRDAFDYVWLIQPPPITPALLAGLQPIWRTSDGALYRVVDRRSPASAGGNDRDQ